MRFIFGLVAGILLVSFAPEVGVVALKAIREVVIFTRDIG